METIVQKAAELGAWKVVPIMAERTVAHLDEENTETKVEKWNAIAIDAIKQCGSAWLPKIAEPLKPAQYLAPGTELPGPPGVMALRECLSQRRSTGAPGSG